MAYVVERPTRAGRGRRFEVRESVSTERGPRSRSLATFTELDEVVLAKARARALRPFDPSSVLASARAAGARVVVEPAAERHARLLIAQLRSGSALPPALSALLRQALPESVENDGNIEAAAEWFGATSEQRGAALVDLLGFADAVPSRVRGPADAAFPRISSR